MNYPFKIKFSSITHLSDARYAAGAWADYIGFCFDPTSNKYIEPAKAKAIIEWLSGCNIVAEFGNQPIEWITEICRELKISIIQIPDNYADSEITGKFDSIFLTDSETTKNYKLFENCIGYITDNATSAPKDTPFYYKIGESYSITTENNLLGISIEGENEAETGICEHHERWNNLLQPYMN